MNWCQYRALRNNGKAALLLRCLWILTANLITIHIVYFKNIRVWLQDVGWPYLRLESIEVVARSKAWVCGRWFAGFVGSNVAGGMYDFLLLVSYVVRYRNLRGSAVVQRSPTECMSLSVIVKPRYWGDPYPLGAVAPWKRNCRSKTCGEWIYERSYT